MTDGKQATPPVTGEDEPAGEGDRLAHDKRRDAYVKTILERDRELLERLAKWRSS